MNESLWRRHASLGVNNHNHLSLVVRQQNRRGTNQRHSQTQRHDWKYRTRNWRTVNERLKMNKCTTGIRQQPHTSWQKAASPFFHPSQRPLIVGGSGPPSNSVFISTYVNPKLAHDRFSRFYTAQQTNRHTDHAICATYVAICRIYALRVCVCAILSNNTAVLLKRTADNRFKLESPHPRSHRPL